MQTVMTGSVLSELFPQIFANLGTFSVTLVAMFLVDYRYALLIIPVLPIYAILMRYYSKKETKVADFKRKGLDDINNQVSEVYDDYEHYKGNAYYSWVEKGVMEKSKNYTKGKFLFDKALIEEFTSTVVTLEAFSIITLAFGAFLVFKGMSTVGTMMAFLRYSRGIVSNFRFFVRFSAYFSSMTVHFERIEKFMSLPEEKEGSKFPASIGYLSGKLKYSIGDREILKDAVFKFEKGKIYGLWGDSGSGKSTLLRILTLLYGDYNGYYLIGDVEGKEISLYRYRRKLGYINQDVRIFNGTVLESIKLDTSIDDQLVKEICGKLGIDQMIENLPNGYHTMLGKSGVELSGGQKQMILLARVIAKDPEVLLLDEATAAIDEKAERKIMEMLQKIKKDRIIVVVSHRRSTLQMCDEIVYMKNGILETKNAVDS